MGTSTDAILFYGLLLDGDEGEVPDLPWWEEWDGDTEAYYLHQQGLECWRPDFTPEESQHYRRRRNELLDAQPCHIILHCSSDYPMYGVAVWSCTAERSCPQALTPDMFTIKRAWEQQLRTYCEQMEIPYQIPGWYLVSYWDR